MFFCLSVFSPNQCFAIILFETRGVYLICYFSLFKVTEVDVVKVMVAHTSSCFSILL